MITIHQDAEIVKFIFYTLGISEDMMNKEEAGKITTHTIINLKESGLYHETKNSLLEIADYPKIDLVPNEFFTFCVLIDFTSPVLFLTFLAPDFV